MGYILKGMCGLNNFVKKLPKAIIASLVTGVLSICIVPVCFGIDEDQELSSNGSSTWDTFTMLLQVILYLAIIIGLFALIIRFVSKRNRISGFGHSVRSLGGVPLGQNKSIQIVEIGDALYVVGVGDNVQLLDKIDDAEEVANVSKLLQSRKDSVDMLSTFGSWLKRSVNRKEAEEEAEDITHSFQQVFQDKLQQVSSRRQKVEHLMSSEKQKDRLNDE